MGSQIEDIASKWLLDPAYAKVFKHTADVVEVGTLYSLPIKTSTYLYFQDYMCYMLTAIGALALSVRFISGLGTGDTNCIITGQIMYMSSWYRSVLKYCKVTSNLKINVIRSKLFNSFIFRSEVN